MPLKRLVPWLSFALLLCATGTDVHASQAGDGRDDTRHAKFRQWDRDRDGRLEAREYPGHPGNFRGMDCDRNGSLDLDEFVNRYECGDRTAARPVSDEFARLDDDADGRIDRWEWVGRAEDFRRLDRDDDRAVTRAEWTDPLDPGRPEGRFEALDRNSDGILSRAEWRRGRGPFGGVDVNDDRVVSLIEYRNATGREGAVARFNALDRDRSGGLSAREWRAEQVGFDLADRDADGRLTLREFRDMPATDGRTTRYDALDRNDDGLLSRWEWRGERVAFEDVDVNDDGRVTIEEYVRML
jgi:Ca2+-binding EF-hand superfamily protein